MWKRKTDWHFVNKIAIKLAKVFPLWLANSFFAWYNMPARNAQDTFTSGLFHIKKRYSTVLSADSVIGKLCSFLLTTFEEEYSEMESDP